MAACLIATAEQDSPQETRSPPPGRGTAKIAAMKMRLWFICWSPGPSGHALLLPPSQASGFPWAFPASGNGCGHIRSLNRSGCRLRSWRSWAMPVRRTWVSSPGAVDNHGSSAVEAAWLMLASPGVDLDPDPDPMGAADEYDLTRWAYVNYFGGSTGYFKVAKQQAVADPWRFLADYPPGSRARIRCTSVRTRRA